MLHDTALVSHMFLKLSILAQEEEVEDEVRTSWDDPCPEGYQEVYKEEERLWGQRNVMRACVLPGTDKERQLKGEATNCRATQCRSPSTRDPCSTLNPRFMDGQQLVYEEVMRDTCHRGSTHQPGLVTLCCRPNSTETALVSTMAAEPNEFPHQAKLLGPGHCGGTVYNKRFIITAAHCMVIGGEVPDPRQNEMKVFLGTNLAGVESREYLYRVSRVIPHEEYSYLANHPEFQERGEDARIYNDIALLEVDRDIDFTGDRIKSLEIAPRNFDPFRYSDKAVIVGWGTTDTQDITVQLQKANFRLRQDPACFTKWPDSQEFAEQMLCVGGVMEGTWSYTAGGGDSGGPAICRKQNGHPVLCGVTSFGGSDIACADHQDEDHCQPSVYAEVAFFHDWIVRHAGEQDPATFYRPYLYGGPPLVKSVMHQVRITSTSGKSCGGTLVAPDQVLTAAQCVFNDNGTKQLPGLKVTTTFKDNKTNKRKQVGVKSAQKTKGFKRLGKPIHERNQGQRIWITDPYYTQDIALVRLKEKLTIPQKMLPELPKSGDTFFEGRELAFGRNNSKPGANTMMSRDFNILDTTDCQARMNRLSIVNLNQKLDRDILCGVEKYSGGSTCDRELGGGLICEGDRGQEVICGVQSFRLCEYSLPNGFSNVAYHSRWIGNSLKKM